MAKRGASRAGKQAKRIYTIGSGMGEQQVSKRRWLENERLARAQDSAAEALRRRREQERKKR